MDAEIRLSTSNPKEKLWTRDFTIITIGSIVSMLGNSLAGFAMDLMVLDYTKSTFLYAIYMMCFTVPQFVMPIISGTLLDRFSRKKTIYMLDFISASLYLGVGVILWTGRFSFPLFAIFCLIIGSINSIYYVAYDSFFPLLVKKENYSKAYSIASVLETLTMAGIPLSAFIYNLIGIVPLLFINSLFFLIAAVLETRIGAKEEYIETRKKEKISDSKGKEFICDLKEGIKYLAEEKGLLAITTYFMISSLCMGAASVITLPYFKSAYKNGEYIYMLIWGTSSLARAVMGTVHYRHKLPAKSKFTIAMIVYVSINFIEAIYLYLPIPLAMFLCFLDGAGGVTSYTIRIAATQGYVPDEKKGRFNGAFGMLTTAGSFTGQILAGLMAVFLPQRVVLAIIMMLGVLAAVFIIGRNKKYVAPLYNQ